MTDSPEQAKIRVLMVCLGNICRSPTAHAVFHKIICDNKLGSTIQVDSAGTGDWHVGEPPDPRAQQTAASRGYDLSALRARQVSREDFERQDYILAMDEANLQFLRQRSRATDKARLQLLLQYGDSDRVAVPDPYYGGDEGFEEVLDLVEAACTALYAHILASHFPPHTPQS